MDKHKLEDGETIIVTSSCTTMYQECCDCNLLHRIDFDWQPGEVHIKFTRVDFVEK